MSTNLEHFKAIVERGFSQGDLTVADEICAEKLIEHEYLTKTDIPGPQILKAQIEDARHSIKDLTLTIEAIVETSDTVWARSKATGFDPRSGKPVTIDVVDICRFADGKLVEHWGCRTDLPFFTRSELCRPRPNERKGGRDGRIYWLARIANGPAFGHEVRFAFEHRHRHWNGNVRRVPTGSQHTSI